MQNQRRKKLIGGNNTRSSPTRIRILPTNTTRRAGVIARVSKQPRNIRANRSKKLGTRGRSITNAPKRGRRFRGTVPGPGMPLGRN